MIVYIPPIKLEFDLDQIKVILLFRDIFFVIKLNPTQ